MEKKQRIKGWENEIDKITAHFVNSFASQSLSALNYKPDPKRWSIAQNVTHIMLLNSSYFRIFDEIIIGKHVLPPSDTLDQVARDSLNIIRPYTSKDRPDKANTWNIWQPSDENVDSKIWSDFIVHQSVFKNHLLELREFFAKPTYIQYPGETKLVFRLEDSIDFLIDHENRHWHQANELLKDMESQTKMGR
jgi:hypothetical protein